MSEQLREYANSLKDLQTKLQKLHNRNMGCEVGGIKYQSYYGVGENYDRALNLARDSLNLNQDFDRYVDWLIRNDNM